MITSGTGVLKNMRIIKIKSLGSIEQVFWGVALK